MSATKTSSRNNPADWSRAHGPDARTLAGKVRRFVLGVTTRTLWQIIGHTLLDAKPETHNAEVFGGAGFVNRPGGRNAEAMVIFTGETAMSPCIIAIRDQEMAAALIAALGGLALGESAMGSGEEGEVACFVHCKADGTVHVRTPSGTAVPLITFDEFMRHGHPTAGTGPISVPAPVTGGALAGTDCIKGH